jgi:serine/threonine-protein kinase
MKSNELQSGIILNNGKYTIKKKIGEGGFGITYEAMQSGLSRTVCIKEFFPAGKCVRNTLAKTVHLQGISGGLFEKYRQAFIKEARTIASLKHPNIIEVIDVFDENNTSYMVMPFIKGKSLQSIVDTNGKLSYSETVNYIAQITDAVSYIHTKNILHRDIKPDNVMITRDYKAILIDFGSAREFEHDKTQAHTSMLTHGYAPTEQYTTNSRKGSYTDIYAIGATFYFALTGKAPLEAAARMAEKMAEPKELNSEIPDEANRTILKAMQIKAENRHQSIQEFMDDLRNIRPSELIDETIGGKIIVIEKSRKWLWRVLTIAIVIIGSLVLYLTLRPENKVVFETKDFTEMGLYPMIKVESGTFTMGSNEIDEDDCSPHTVTLDGFYIGQFEVSQGFFKKIMGYNPSASQPETNRDGKPYTQAQRDSFPVENVSFEEIQQFISHLNQQIGKQFFLPSEAQWEFAARGGNKSQGYKYAGMQFPNNIWYNRERPFRIKYDPSVNELGIYQMSGNVAEWCLDYYDRDFYNQSKNSRNPINTEEDVYRVIRGGSFSSTDADEVTVFMRDADNVKLKNTGFRLVIK